MEGGISQNWRILAATLFSAALIIGAYIFAKGFESPQVAQASDETMLLKAIATKDSDKDGLADWEEALYGTDPRNVDTFNLGLSDGEAVTRGLIVPKAISDIVVATSTPSDLQSLNPDLPPPAAEGTLTAAFAKSFFSLYVKAKQDAGGADLTEEEVNTISEQAINTLSASVTVAPDYKTAKELVVAGSGVEAMKEFAAAVEAVLLKNTSSGTSTPLVALKSAIMNGDAAAYENLRSTAKMYRSTAAGLAVLPVPKELAATDLLLINTLMRMGGVVGDFALAETDPLAAIFALKQYVKVTTDLNKAFADLGRVYSTAGISLPRGTPGSSIVNMIADIDLQVSAAKKP